MDSEFVHAFNNQQYEELGDRHSAPSTKLASLKHFPQPIFLLNKDLTLVEMNSQGEAAIDKHWVGLYQGKIHFNCREKNNQVRAIIENLYAARDSLGNGEMPSKRFILRNIDMEFRAYTLSFESLESDGILLTIQGDLNCCDSKLQSLANVFSLSSSETKIIKLMVDGLKPKQIAFEAGISLNTVRSHLRTLYAKMQVNDYNEALTCAIRLLT